MRTDAVLLATRNKGKVAEFELLLSEFGVKILTLDDFPELQEVEETGETFLENAMLKASYAAKASGLVALADDSGLMVDFLHGAPGVYSARYSAEDGEEPTDANNNVKLLVNLHDVPIKERSARFCSVIAAVSPSGASIHAEGLWEGYITNRPVGDNGFGYDPLFMDKDIGITAAQMTKTEKNKHSHRARALHKLQAMWPDFWQKIQAGAEPASKNE